MNSISQKEDPIITDINDPNSIFEIANEFRVRSIAESFGRTIHSKEFRQDLQKEISQKLKDPKLNELVVQRIREIAHSERVKSFKEYETKLEERFPPSQTTLVKEIKDNARSAFIKAEYIIRTNLKSDMEKWLQNTLKNPNFIL